VSRRQVRVAQSFFDRLDVLLPEERGDDGTPSTADFLLHDLPPIIDVLAVSYEARTMATPDDPAIRLIVIAGVLVSRVALYVTLAADDAVEIIGLRIDFDR
jgi:hypothetical protein